MFLLTIRVNREMDPEPSPHTIPVVGDFLDIFPKELLGLLPGEELSAPSIKFLEPNPLTYLRIK